LPQNTTVRFTGGEDASAIKGEIIKGPKGATMGILRKAIVAGGLFVALPSPPQGAHVQLAEQQAGPGTFAYVAAASDAFADVRSFCQRRPMACDVAQYIAVTAQAKAKYSAKIAYEWANTPGAPKAYGQAGDALAVEGQPPQTADAGDIPIPIEKPAKLLARKAAQKKS
jgi:hypothetical protein